MGPLKTIAIIMARAGSKGLPGKNLKPLAGKPLLAYSIEQAKASGVCDVVLVTTEDETIGRVAREYGAEVPFLRPPELAEDFVPPEPVIQHALVTYESLAQKKFDIVVYLQPTDIFRTPAMIRECVEKLKKHPELDTVFSAYKTHKHYWHKSSEGFVRLDAADYSARQGRGDRYLYREDQGVASATRAHLVRQGRRVGDKVDLIISDDFRTSIDIHTPFDFWLAEKVLTEWTDGEKVKKDAGNPEENFWLGSNLKSWSQSIRNGYIRSFLIFALHEVGVFEALRRGGPKTTEELAKKCSVNAHILDGILHFLLHADKVLEKKNGRFSLTERGKWLFEDPVLAMSFGAVGGYACLLYELVPTLRNEKRYGVDFERRGDLIAKGSYYTGKGNYPWVVSQLAQLGVRTVADLGCGLADVLIGFCRLDPKLKGVGVDISQDALKEATLRVKEAALSERIRLVQGDITRPETFGSAVKEAEAFNGIMVFHEFLRDGEEAVVEMFRRMKKEFPGRYLLVGEFDRLSDEEFQAMPFADRIHPLFYQYVIHPLTWQGLPMEKERWLSLFERAGLRLVTMKDDFPFRLVEFVLQF